MSPYEKIRAPIATMQKLHYPKREIARQVNRILNGDVYGMISDAAFSCALVVILMAKTVSFGIPLVTLIGAVFAVEALAYPFIMFQCIRAVMAIRQ